MPSKTEKQREMMAIALHRPGKLYKKNRGVLKMSHQQMHEFAVKAYKHDTQKRRKKR